MASYQQDNSFFVEGDNQFPRMDFKEAARLIARQRQEMIGCELSRLDSEEYLEDMMQHLRQLEVGLFLVLVSSRLPSSGCYQA